MKRYSILVMSWLTLILTISSILLGCIITYVLKIELIRMFILLPLGFFICGLLMVMLLNITDRKNDKRLLQLFLFLKFVKNVNVAILGLVYVFILDVSFKYFLILAGIYYLIYLAFETISLYRFEKLLKKLNG